MSSDPSTYGRTLVQLYHKLVSQPFFPLLFISKSIEIYIIAGYELTPPAVRMALFSVIATGLWLLSDAEIDWHGTIVENTDDESESDSQ